MANNRQQRFRLLCTAADKIVADTGVSPSDLTGYAVSQAAFGRKPNGDFYGMFEEWLKQRQAVPGAPPVDMPADATAQLEEWTDHLKAQIMQRVTGIVRGVAGSFEQTTALRVIALERLCADQARRNAEVRSTLVDTEQDLEEARERTVALEHEAQELRNRVQRLLGRIEQLTGSSVPTPVEANAATSCAPNAGDNAATEGPTGPADVESSGVGEIVHFDAPESEATASVTGDGGPVPAANTAKDQPPAIVTPTASGGQIEMPIVDDADAEKANGGDDDDRG